MIETRPETYALIVVPLAGVGHRLIAPGRCGARAPVANRWNLPNCATPWESGYGDGSGQAALVVWWKGELVPEGWDRLRRLWVELPGHTPLQTGHQLDVTLDQAEIVARDIERFGLVRVARLSRTETGRLVEVSS